MKLGEKTAAHNAGAGRGAFARALASAGRALEAESERWFLWLFATGILTYFSLPNEPGIHFAAALVLGAAGLVVVARHAPLGLVLGGACLAFALGFATAKLRTETVRVPVLHEEPRYVAVTGFVEDFERRVDKRSRLTLRTISVGNLVFPPATAASYSVENWLLADGDDRDAETVLEDRAFRCDLLGCIGTVKARLSRSSANPAHSRRIAVSRISSLRRSASAKHALRASSSTGAC